MRRVNKIVTQERQAGYQAIATGIYSDTVDIVVYKDTQIVRVYEVTNYAMDGYIQLDRGKRYRDNLLQYPVQKLFVCSSNRNLRCLPGGTSFFTQHGIKVRVMGYQDYRSIILHLSPNSHLGYSSSRPAYYLNRQYPLRQSRQYLLKRRTE